MTTSTFSGQHEGSLRENAVAQLAALLTISRQTSLAEDDDELLRYAASTARQALRASSVSIERFEREHGWLRTLVNDGDLAPDEETLPEEEVYPIAEYHGLSLLDAGSQLGSVSNRDDPDIDPAEARLLDRLGKQCSLEVPIVVDGQVWGILYATRVRGEPGFAGHDLEFAYTVAAQVAAGVAQGAHTRRLEALASLDPLTGLASRRALDEKLDVAIDDHLTIGTPVTVVVCDVNGLKRVNDEQGHPAGDKLLRQLGEMISVAAGALPGSLAGRLGGDEFCLVVPELPADEVIAAVKRLIQLTLGLPSGAGLACGVASTLDPIGAVTTVGDLLRLADEAQYRAKRAGIAEPVVAGRALPAAVAAALATAPGGSSRTGGRRGHDVAGLLVNELVERLDDCPDEHPVQRLSLLAAAVCETVNGAAWWVGVATGERAGPRTERFTALRPAAGSSDPAHSEQVGLEGAARDGWLISEHLLAASGRHGADRWVVAVLADECTRSLASVGPALRALVATALADPA